MAVAINRGKTSGTFTRAKNSSLVAGFLTTTAKFSDKPEIYGNGWVGSTAHRSKDIETLKGILPPLANAGKVKLYHGGDHPGASSFASKLGVDPSLVTVRPLAPAGEYPSLLTMDVGIVPLNKTPFNMAKSDIKGLEYFQTDHEAKLLNDLDKIYKDMLEEYKYKKDLKIDNDLSLQIEKTKQLEIIEKTKQLEITEKTKQLEIEQNKEQEKTKQLELEQNKEEERTKQLELEIKKLILQLELLKNQKYNVI